MLSPETGGVLGQKYFAERRQEQEGRQAERRWSNKKTVFTVLAIAAFVVVGAFFVRYIAYEATCTPLATVQCQLP